MSMTKEEAIEAFQKFVNGYEKNIYGEAARQNGFVQAIKVVISALRPITREQVEKVWRGEWEDMREAYNDVPKRRCSRCKSVFIGLDTPFCDACGAPMTDKAVEMVMERLEVLGYGKDD